MYYCSTCWSTLLTLWDWAGRVQIRPTHSRLQNLPYLSLQHHLQGRITHTPYNQGIIEIIRRFGSGLASSVKPKDLMLVQLFKCINLLELSAIYCTCLAFSYKDYQQADERYNLCLSCDCVKQINYFYKKGHLVFNLTTSVANK